MGSVLSIGAVEGISGMSGAIIPVCLFYPLENLKTRVQVIDYEGSVFSFIQEIVRTEGISSFYSGINQNLTAIACSNVIYFSSYKLLQQLGNSTIVSNMTFGLLAAWINILLTAPLWTISTRKKVPKKGGAGSLTTDKGLFMEVWEAIKKDGILSMYDPWTFFLSLVPAIQY